MNQIKYNNEIIQYNLIRAKIKNLYIHIKNGQVIVKAPLKLKDKYIEEFINRKAKWIYEKLEQEKSKPKDNEIKKEDIENLQKIVECSIKKYSEKLKLKPNKVRIKKIKYAWGSCSSNKNITINLNLATKEDKVIEYVVLHEMCHLKFMNHSKDFWNLVESQMSDYKECKRNLK